MECGEVDEALGAFALGALAADEERDLRAHLEDCGRHATAVQFRAAALALAAEVPERSPPTDLRERILTAVETEARGETRKPVRSGRGPAPSWVGRRRTGLLAAALAMIALGLIGWNVALQLSDDEPTRRAFVGSVGATGHAVLLLDEGLVVLRFDGLDPLPAGRVYQLWTLSDAGAAPSATFSAGAEPVTVTIPLDIDATSGIALTEEPAGGSPQPTGSVLLSTQF